MTTSLPFEVADDADYSRRVKDPAWLAEHVHLRFVPEADRTETVCILALEADRGEGDQYFQHLTTLKAIPEAFWGKPAWLQRLTEAGLTSTVFWAMHSKPAACRAALKDLALLKRLVKLKPKCLLFLKEELKNDNGPLMKPQAPGEEAKDEPTLTHVAVLHGVLDTEEDALAVLKEYRCTQSKAINHAYGCILSAAWPPERWTDTFVARCLDMGVTPFPPDEDADLIARFQAAPGVRAAIERVIHKKCWRETRGLLQKMPLAFLRKTDFIFAAMSLHSFQGHRYRYYNILPDSYREDPGFWQSLTAACPPAVIVVPTRFRTPAMVTASKTWCLAKGEPDFLVRSMAILAEGDPEFLAEFHAPEPGAPGSEAAAQAKALLQALTREEILQAIQIAQETKQCIHSHAEEWITALPAALQEDFDLFKRMAVLSPDFLNSLPLHLRSNEDLVCDILVDLPAYLGEALVNGINPERATDAALANADDLDELPLLCRPMGLILMIPWEMRNAERDSRAALLDPLHGVRYLKQDYLTTHHMERLFAALDNVEIDFYRNNALRPNVVASLPPHFLTEDLLQRCLQCSQFEVREMFDEEGHFEKWRSILTLFPPAVVAAMPAKDIDRAIQVSPALLHTLPEGMKTPERMNLALEHHRRIKYSFSQFFASFPPEALAARHDIIHSVVASGNCCKAFFPFLTLADVLAYLKMKDALFKSIAPKFLTMPAWAWQHPLLQSTYLHPDAGLLEFESDNEESDVEVAHEAPGSEEAPTEW